MGSDVSVFEHLGVRKRGTGVTDNQINCLESFVELTSNMYTYLDRK